jgi:hypothetical protein
VIAFLKVHEIFYIVLRTDIGIDLKLQMDFEILCQFLLTDLLESFYKIWGCDTRTDMGLLKESEAE